FVRKTLVHGYPRPRSELCTLAPSSYRKQSTLSTAGRVPSPKRQHALRHPPRRPLTPTFFDLHPDRGEPEVLGRAQSGAGAHERVEHEAPFRCIGSKKLHDCSQRLLIRVKTVYFTLPVERVRDHPRRRRRVALGKEEGSLVPVPRKASQ